MKGAFCVKAYLCQLPLLSALLYRGGYVGLSVVLPEIVTISSFNIQVNTVIVKILSRWVYYGVKILLCSQYDSDIRRLVFTCVIIVSQYCRGAIKGGGWSPRP